MRAVNLLVLFLLALIISCKTDNTTVNPGNYDPGILKTDEFGNVIGGDSADWCIYHGSPFPFFSFGPSYPNPVSGSFFKVKASFPDTDTVSFYFLKNQNDTIFVVKNNPVLIAGGYTFECSVNGLNFTNTYQRLYINTKKSYTPFGNCNFFGDIKFEN